MKVWAKIISLFVIIFVLFSMYAIMKFLMLPISYWIYSIPLWVIFGIIIDMPFFYYGWFKNQENKYIKLFTKGMSIMYSVFVLYVAQIFNGLELFDVFLVALALIFVAPLYYYAWIS